MSTVGGGEQLRDLEPAVGLPGTDFWQECADLERVEWPQIFPELAGEIFDETYDPYNDRSVFMALKRGSAIVGMSRVVLPNPSAEVFEDSDTLAMHDTMYGNPFLGPQPSLHVSEEGWDHLRRFHPRFSVDYVTHFVDRTQPDHSKIVVDLESMGVGITRAHAACHEAEVTQQEKIDSGPVVVTDLVQYYLRGMRKRYNLKGDNPVTGVQTLGDPRPYGAKLDELHNWVTVVAISINDMVEADRLKHDPPLLQTDLFDQACPDFAEGYEAIKQNITGQNS